MNPNNPTSVTIIESHVKNVASLQIDLYPVPGGTKEQTLMYSAYKNAKKLRDSDSYMKDIGLQIFANWANMLNIEITGKDLHLAYDFCVQSFDDLNLYDLAQAIILFLARKLKTREEDFIKADISPLYIGKVLTKYKMYREDILNEAKDKIIKINKPKDITYTPEQRKLIFEAFLVYAFKTSMAGQFFDDTGDRLYNFIRNNSLIEIDQKLIDAALKHADESMELEAKLTEKQKQKKHGIKSEGVELPESLKKTTTKEQSKKISRSYVVNYWLKSFHADIKLTPEDLLSHKGRLTKSAKEELLMKKKNKAILTFFKTLTIEMIDK